MSITDVISSAIHGSDKCRYTNQLTGLLGGLTEVVIYNNRESLRVTGYDGKYFIITAEDGPLSHHTVVCTSTHEGYPAVDIQPVPDSIYMQPVLDHNGRVDRIRVETLGEGISRWRSA